MSIKYFSVLSGSLFASLIVLTSCLPAEDSTTTGSTAIALNGSWSSVRCESEPGGYFLSKVTFNTVTGTALSSSGFYSDSNCLIIIEEYRADVTWFALGKTTTTVSGLTAREINGFEAEEMLTPVWYSIYRIDGDLLYFGDSTDIETTSTPENRPTSLDFENPMTRI